MNELRGIIALSNSSNAKVKMINDLVAICSMKDCDSRMIDNNYRLYRMISDAGVRGLPDKDLNLLLNGFKKPENLKYLLSNGFIVSRMVSINGSKKKYLVHFSAGDFKI